MIPGYTERPEAAAAGFCYTRSRGHEYQVDCWKWHILLWCERVFLAFFVLAFLWMGVRAVVKIAHRLFADSSRASASRSD